MRAATDDAVPRPGAVHAGQAHGPVPREEARTVRACHGPIHSVDRAHCRAPYRAHQRGARRVTGVLSVGPPAVGGSGREQILAVCLWLSVVAWSTWVGGTLFQMLVVVPLWSASPPESVRHFFTATAYNRTISRFFGPPFMLARVLPVVAALVAAWPSAPHRAPLLLATACIVAAVVFTLAYVYPINAVLFAQAGGAGGPDAVRRLVRTWVAADAARFAVGLVAFAAILYAFRLPAAFP